MTAHPELGEIIKAWLEEGGTIGETTLILFIIVFVSIVSSDPKITSIDSGWPKASKNPSSMEHQEGGRGRQSCCCLIGDLTMVTI